MTVSAFLTNLHHTFATTWSFLADLWEQLAFWATFAHLPSRVHPRPEVADRPARFADLALLIALIVAAFAARLAVLFLAASRWSISRGGRPTDQRRL